MVGCHLLVHKVVVTYRSQCYSEKNALSVLFWTVPIGVNVKPYQGSLKNFFTDVQVIKLDIDNSVLPYMGNYISPYNSTEVNLFMAYRVKAAR